MKISEKQLLFLIQVLRDSLKFGNNYWGYSADQRGEFLDQIANQQSDELRDVE